MNKKLVRWLVIFFAIFVATLTIDLVTKRLTHNEFPRELISGVLSINFTRNRGIAFGWFYGAGIVLIIISSLLIIGAAIWYAFVKLGKMKGFDDSRLLDVGMAFFFSGAIGNLVDRIFFGYVRDFISLDFINFPIFNFADIFINIAMILIVIYLFKSINNSDIISKNERETERNDKSENIGEST